MISRGAVVAVADRGGDYTSKPRPAIVVQSNLFNDLKSLTICPVTSVAQNGILMRVPITPSASLSLRTESWIEVDKITTVRRDRIGTVMGQLVPQDMQALNSALALFLGFAG